MEEEGGVYVGGGPIDELVGFPQDPQGIVIVTEVGEA
jgi:hypothetical protein